MTSFTISILSAITGDLKLLDHFIQERIFFHPVTGRILHASCDSLDIARLHHSGLQFPAQHRQGEIDAGVHAPRADAFHSSDDLHDFLLKIFENIDVLSELMDQALVADLTSAVLVLLAECFMRPLLHRSFSMRWSAMLAW